jgi:hypothetical protein
MWLLLVLFGLLVVAAMNVLAGAEVLLCVGRPSANKVFSFQLLFPNNIVFTSFCLQPPEQKY